MKNFLVAIVILAIVAGGVGYWRGWFSLTNDGKVDVQVDSSKFQQDRNDVSKSIGVQAKAVQDKWADVWKKSESLTGDEKIAAQKELNELKMKHERIEQQLKDLETAGEDKFVSLKQDLSKALSEVETKIDDLTKRIQKSKVQ